MAQVNKKNFKKAKNRKNKTLLVFNEEKRREFLSGFHKRKLQRKKHAQEQLALELKEERKRLRQEARESYKELVVSRRPVPELDDLLAEEYEDDDVTVKVTELSTSQIAQQNNWIGENRPQYEVADDQEEQSEDEQPNEDNIPGMELKQKPKTKVKKDIPELKTKKDIKKVLKKKATKNVQKSKAFQLKNKLEQQKNRKKSLQQKKERIKLRTQNNKKRGKNNH